MRPGPDPRRVFALLGLLVLSLAGGGFAENFGDLSIEPEPMYSETPSHGYLDYRLVIVNRSPGQGHELTLEFSPDGSFSGSSDIEAIRRSVFVGPGADVSVSLYQPSLAFDGDSVKVTVDGNQFSKVLPLRSALTYMHRTANPLILMERSLDLDDVEEKLGIKDKESYSRDILVTEASAQIGKWPTNWLGYSRYDGIILASRELAAAPAEVRGAIHRYVEAGGSVLLLGPAEIPPPWNLSRTENSGLRIHAVGFGRMMVYSHDDPRSMGADQWKDARRFWTDSAYFWSGEVREEEANRRLPVTEGTAIPVRAMFLLIFAFTLCIGPVNLWVLARIKRKIWVFWTIPLFSLVTCGVIFGYALLAEGWDITARAEGFTILDETSHRATSLSWCGFYSPLTYSEGFRFSLESEVTLCAASYRYNRETRGRRIEWGNAQQLGLGWLAARVPTHFMVRRSETRRERITPTSLSDGGFGVVNGLGKRVKKLWLCTSEGKVYQGEDLAPGQEVRLTFDKELKNSGAPEELRKVYVNDWTARIREVSKNPYEFLWPGTYLAEIDGAPFLDAPIKDPTDVKEHSFVLGIMKGGSE